MSFGTLSVALAVTETVRSCALAAAGASSASARKAIRIGIREREFRERFKLGSDFRAKCGYRKDPSFPIRVYARAVRRRDRLSGAHREAFDAALDWAAMGSGAEMTHPRGRLR